MFSYLGKNDKGAMVIKETPANSAGVSFIISCDERSVKWGLRNY